MRGYPLPPKLQPYFSPLYYFHIADIDPAASVERHYPDWAGIHFYAEGEPYEAGIGDGEMLAYSAFTAHGPTSQSLSLKLTRSRAWSLGISPVGWARYADGDASDVANTFLDTGIGKGEDGAFAQLAPILDIVRRAPRNPEKTAEAVIAFLLQVPLQPSPSEDRIIALQRALLDPDVGDVESLVEKVNMSRRTVERLSSRYFGFAPKLLLRRQRFLRSLSKFSINPERSWSACLDGHYVDQAHFVRDFRGFMGMKPSEYALMPHPILDPIFTQRLSDQGAHPA